MSTATELQARTNAALASQGAALQKGTCTAIDWVNGVATVILPGTQIDLPMVGVAPILNERCWVATVAAQMILLGPVTRPPYGAVAGSPAGGLVTVLCDDTVRRDVTFQDSTGLTSGARVLIDWTGGGQIVGLPQADPNTGLPLNLPGVITPGGPQAITFNPYTSATWRDGTYGSGWIGGQVWDADHNRGAWFYQGIADTIPDNAVDGHLSIFVPSGDGYGGNPSIGAHALGGPSGTLGITGRKVIPSGGGWIDISEFFDGFKTGALLGIGTGGGGNWKFPPAGQNNSGAIAATWRS